MRNVFIFLAAVAFLAYVSAQYVYLPCSYEPNDPCGTIFSLTNQLRAQRGVSPLNCDSRLNAAAAGHSQDMATNRYFSHMGSDGSSEEDRATRQGYPVAVISENIAAGSSSPQETMADISYSTPSYNRLMDPEVSDFGCGFYQGGPYRYYWTQMFGKQKQVKPPETPLPISDVTYQYAVLTYDLNSLSNTFLNVFDPKTCFYTQFIRETAPDGREVGNVQRVSFMGKDIQLHLNQLFCGRSYTPTLWEGASPFCPNAPNITLPFNIEYTGTADDTQRSPILPAFVNKKKMDLEIWGRKYASCDLTMYACYLLFHGEGLQHAVIRPGQSTKTTDALVHFLRNTTRCLVQAVNGINNPDFPGLTDLFFFSIFPCPPGNTYEEIINHPLLPFVVGAVVEVPIEGPMRRDLAEVLQERYNIEIPHDHYVD